MKRNWGSLKYEIEKVDRRWKFSYIFFLCSTPRVVLCGSLELSGTRLFSIGFRVLCTLCKFDHHTWMGTRSNCLEQSSACICLEKKQFLICKAEQGVPCFRRSDWLWLRGNGNEKNTGGRCWRRCLGLPHYGGGSGGVASVEKCGGILPQNIFTIEVLRNGISGIPAQSASCNVQFYKEKTSC